jgi:hypothetical protein
MILPDPPPPGPSLSGLGVASDTASGVSAGRDDGWPNLPTCPSDVLLESIVAFLAPLFVGSTTDPGLARLAAIETFASYQARTQVELVSVAQIIGLGLAAMDNLRLAMQPDLSLAMKLRLRASANALNRSARQTLHALEGRRRGDRSVRPGAAGGAEERVAVPAVGAIMEDRPSAPVADRASVAQPAVVQSAVAPVVIAPSAVAATAQSGSTPPSPVQRGPIQAASAPPAPAVASRALASSGGQVGSLVWADAMTKVATELTGKAGSALARPRSRSDLMWADTLASVALRLTGGRGGTPGVLDAGLLACNLGNGREPEIHRRGE